MVESETCRATSSCNWSQQFKRTRTVREKLLSSNDANITFIDGTEFWNHFRSLKEDVREQISKDCSNGSCYVESTTTTDSSTSTDTINQYNKHRLALRVALCCLSIPTGNHSHDELRRTIQQESFDSWCTALLIMIMNKDIDESCRLLAAQVLCNTITDCTPTALRFMKEIVSPAPTDVAITDKIRDVVLIHPMTSDSVSLESSIIPNLPPTSTMLFDTNWVDLILASTTSRPLLAVVVACLHNSICSLTNCTTNTTNNENDSNVIHEIIHNIAASKLLISTFLRRIVSALSVQQSQKTETTKTKTTITTMDEATEWISLLISKLCRLGLLPEMYQSIGGNKDDCCNVYPEHVVLLHSVRNMMEENENNHVDGTDWNSIDVDQKSRCYCLGGENRTENGQAMIDTHVFLAGLYIMLSAALLESEKKTTSDNEALQASALQLLLDILAESLSEDSTISNRIRHILGSTTSLIQSIVFDLARILDHWHDANQALYARDQAKMNETDQCRITTSVRVIGNLCFHCRQNQDLLRTITIPITSQNNRSTSKKMERNGLHVLLSTTSMSYVCFTLREWAVVAIRSVLEDCLENQAIVSELEGQSAMQTADLEDMGIRVNLNVPTGTVTVDQLLDK